MNRELLLQTAGRYQAVIDRQIEAGKPFSERLLGARRWRVAVLWVLSDQKACWREYELLVEAEKLRERRVGPEGTYPKWFGDPFPGQRLLICAHEAGAGDVFQFLRLVPRALARGGEVSVHCQADVLRLFQHSLPREIRWIAEREDGPEPDLEVHFYELLFALGVEFTELAADVPYLFGSPEIVDGWRRRLGPATGPRVGLCWTNALIHQQPDLRRYLALPWIAPWFEVSGLTWVALQKGARSKVIEEAGLTGRLLDFGDELGDFADTAGLIHHLDLVVTIDTSIAHLAGAMGKPTWLVLDYKPFEAWWVGGRPDSTAWYPTMKIFRQEKQSEWDEIVAEVRGCLEELVTSPT